MGDGFSWFLPGLGKQERLSPALPFAPAEQGCSSHTVAGAKAHRDALVTVAPLSLCCAGRAPGLSTGERQVSTFLAFCYSPTIGESKKAKAEPRRIGEIDWE